MRPKWALGSGCERRRGPCKALENRPRMGRRGRRDELVPLAPREAQAVGIPGIELAQIAARSVHAEVVLGGRDHPFELLEDLVRGGLVSAGAEQAAEQPRVAERPAREHHGAGSALVEGAADAVLARQAA